MKNQKALLSILLSVFLSPFVVGQEMGGNAGESAIFIGNKTITGNLTVTGDLTVEGSVTVDVDSTVTGDLTVTGQILAAAGDASDPGYSFASDPDSGWYSGGSGNVSLSLNGTRGLFMTSTTFGLNLTSGPGLQNEAATATNPTLIPRRSDVTSGIGSTGNASISLIVASVEVQRITESSGVASTRMSDAYALSNTAEGNVGNLAYRTTTDLVTMTGSQVSTTTIDIPTGAEIKGCQFNVNTAVVTSGATNTWDADFVGGSTTNIVAAGAAGAEDTKAGSLIVSELASSETNVEFDAPAAETFSSGVIEVVCYYVDLTDMDDV